MLNLIFAHILFVLNMGSVLSKRNSKCLSSLILLFALRTDDFWIEFYIAVHYHGNNRNLTNSRLLKWHLISGKWDE